MRKALLLGTFLLLSSVKSFASSELCSEVSQHVRVSAVYPTADILPENLLRFYIYFDRPMRTENTLSHVYLIDENDKKLEGVFLENKYSLWSPDRTRLTLLFDPGRVKTGLVAHNTLGRAIKADSTYSLVVNAGSINNSSCANRYKKRFAVKEANYKKPDISNWHLSQPQVGSKQPLTIDFDAPIDHTSLAFRIRVKNGLGEIVLGSIDIGQQEKQWLFTPEQEWLPGEAYSLFIDPILEDIAGNRISGLFDQPSLIKNSMNNGKDLKVEIQLAR